jgi:hypothetical protein
MTNTMEQVYPSDGDNFSVGQEISPLFMYRRFLTVFTKSQIRRYPELVESS